MINYAHRGASEYAAQNTLSAFYLGLACGANGIETDIRLTKDNVSVLFHDDVVDNITDGKGSVNALTLEELKKLTVYGKRVNDRIITLSTFFEHFGWRELNLALELKSEGAAKPVADLVRKYGAEALTYITSFNYAYLAEMRAYAPELKLGYLVGELTEEVNEQIDKLGIQQICPPSWLITPAVVSDYKTRRLSVRAWGVRNEEDMIRCVNAGVDGMTVNFPDRLASYLAVTSR